MANILEFVRGVLTDGEAQEAFRADPNGFLAGAGFADLTGEDVVEAIAVLRRSLPGDTASALAPFDDEDELPAVRPAHDERELDAAARLLEFAVAQVRVPAVVASAVINDSTAAPEPAPAATTEARAVHDDEPIEIESELDTTVGPAPASVTAHGADGIPSVAAFAKVLTDVANEAQARHDEVLQRLVADHERQTQQVADQLRAILDQAERDAEAIRATAEASIIEERTAAAADRAEARAELDRSRSEADQILHRAREQAEEVRIQSEQLLTAATAQAEAARQEIEMRKAELREAERQLKERLTGIDSLFRNVLRDDETGSAGPT